MRRSFLRAHDVCVHTIDRQTDRHKRNHKYSHSSHTTYFGYSYNSINSVKPFPPSTHLRFSVAALCDICMALCIQTRTNTMTPSPLLPVVRLRCGADDTYPPHTPVPHHTSKLASHHLCPITLRLLSYHVKGATCQLASCRATPLPQ